MGLDDLIFDSKLIQTILHKLKYDLSTYTDEDISDGNLDLWESEMYYNGYSVVFHSLLPLFTALAAGMQPTELTPEQRNKVRKLTRKRILEYIEKCSEPRYRVTVNVLDGDCDYETDDDTEYESDDESC